MIRMSKITLTPQKLKGIITVPSSKSVTHRALICAALSQNCTVKNVTFSKDIKATLSGLEAMGCVFEAFENSVTFKDFNLKEKAYIDADESGTTLRLLIPIVASLGINAVFNGKGRLPLRPLDEYERIFKDKISFCLTDGHLPLKISGKYSDSTVFMNGNISSQYISGMLLCAPLLKKDFSIVLQTELLSEPYVNITCDVMRDFGINAQKEKNTYTVKCGQYTPQDYFCEGDYSAAAFWLCANKMGCDISINGLKENSTQGDNEIINILKNISTCQKIDASQIPDLVPILAVCACAFEKKTYIYGCERLKYKESDRILSTVQTIKALGGEVYCDDKSITICGKGYLKGGEVDSFNDHRIAMSAAIASTICKDNVIINDYKCVDKSYPQFFEHFVKAGGKIYEQQLG